MDDISISKLFVIAQRHGQGVARMDKALSIESSHHTIMPESSSDYISKLA
jgi:hypothetical protein